MKQTRVNLASGHCWVFQSLHSPPPPQTGLRLFQPQVKELVLSKLPLLPAKIWVTRGRAVENLINLRIYFLATEKKIHLLVS